MNSKILDPNFDYASSTIIKPPQNNPVEFRQTIVIIDSRDRDITKYPSPNNYYIELNQEIEEVITGEVILMDVPLCNYIINEFNNSFIIKYNDILQNVEIPIGNYNGTELAFLLKNTLSPLTDNGLDVLYSSNLNKLIFNNTVFQFVNVPIPVALLLGLDPNSTETNAPLTLPNMLNLNVNNYIILSIDMFSINASSNTVIDRTTALVHKQDSLITYRGLLKNIKKKFNPIIGRLTRLHISFTDYYGNPYNFRNIDHRIEIMFESRKHLNRYMH